MLHSQETFQVLPQNRFFLLLGETLKPLHPRHWRRLPTDIRPIAAEYNAVGTNLVEQKAQGRLAAGQTVVVQTPLIGTGGLVEVDTGFGTHLPPPIQAPHAKAGRTAAVGNAHLELGA